MSNDQIGELLDEKVRIIYQNLLEDLRKKAVKASSIEEFCGPLTSSVSISKDKLDDEVLNMLKRGENLLGGTISEHMDGEKTIYELSISIKKYNVFDKDNEEKTH